MYLKKAIAAASAAVMIFSLSACDGEEKSLTIKEGVLIVGIEPDYPPMEYLSEDGSQTGFDAELAQEIASRLNLQVEFVNTEWERIFTTLDAGGCDVIISSVSVTEERLEAYSLTEPYLTNRLCIISGSDSISSPADLDGKRIATQAGTTADTYIEKLIDGGLEAESYTTYNKISYCFNQLRQGMVDAVVADSLVANYYIGENSDKYGVTWLSDESELMAACLKKDNEELTALVDKAIDDIYSDGTFANLSAKYFGDCAVSAR